MTRRQHGTRAMYVREKCRCEDCRTANREYSRARERRYAGVRRALTRGDDITFLRGQLTARAAALRADVDMPRGEKRGRLDEITRTLALIDNAGHYRDQLLQVLR